MLADARDEGKICGELGDAGEVEIEALTTGLEGDEPVRRAIAHCGLNIREGRRVAQRHHHQPGIGSSREILVEHRYFDVRVGVGLEELAHPAVHCRLIAVRHVITVVLPVPGVGGTASFYATTATP